MVYTVFKVVMYGTSYGPNMNALPLTWHQIRPSRYEAETTPLVLSCMCNKRLLSPTARHAGKRPSEQFAVSFLPTIYLKKKRVNFTQERVLLSLN